MRGLDVIINMHFGSRWEACMEKFLKSFPYSLLGCKIYLNVDASSVLKNREKWERATGTLATMLNRHGMSKVTPAIVTTGLKENLLNSVNLSTAEYVLICEYDFMFHNNFKDLNVPEILTALKSDNTDFLFFNRTSNTIEKWKLTGLYKEVEVNGIPFISTKFYTNNTFICKRKTYRDLLLEIFPDGPSTGNRGSHGIEPSAINIIQKNPEKFNCKCMGKLDDGPYIHHLDGSENYHTFDLYFNKIKQPDVIRQKINYYTGDTVYVLDGIAEEHMTYIKKVAYFNNMNVEITSDVTKCTICPEDI